MSHLPRFALALLVVFGLLMPGTFAEEEPAAPAPVKPGGEEKPKDDEAPKAEEAEAEASGKKLEVIEAGTEPRVLRFKPTAGTKLTTEATLLTGFSAGGMGGSAEITIVVDATIEKGSEDGLFKMAGKLTKCEVKDNPNDMMTAQIKPMIDALTGVTFEGEYNARGKWTRNPGSNLKGVPPQSASFAQLISVVFGGLIVELPEAALGTGGSWKMTNKSGSAEAPDETEATYTVDKIEGEVVTLQFVSKNVAKNQKLRMMGMEMNVLERTVDASGSLTLDLALGVAKAGKLKIKSAQNTDAMGEIVNTVDGKQATKAAATATTEAPADSEGK